MHIVSRRFACIIFSITPLLFLYITLLWPTQLWQNQSNRNEVTVPDPTPLAVVVEARTPQSMVSSYPSYLSTPWPSPLMFSLHQYKQYSSSPEDGETFRFSVTTSGGLSYAVGGEYFSQSSLEQIVANGVLLHPTASTGRALAERILSESREQKQTPLQENRKPSPLVIFPAVHQFVFAVEQWRIRQNKTAKGGSRTHFRWAGVVVEWLHPRAMAQSAFPPSLSKILDRLAPILFVDNQRDIFCCQGNVSKPTTTGKSQHASNRHAYGFVAFKDPSRNILLPRLGDAAEAAKGTTNAATVQVQSKETLRRRLALTFPAVRHHEPAVPPAMPKGDLLLSTHFSPQEDGAAAPTVDDGGSRWFEASEGAEGRTRPPRWPSVALWSEAFTHQLTFTGKTSTPRATAITTTHYLSFAVCVRDWLAVMLKDVFMGTALAPPRGKIGELRTYTSLVRSLYASGCPIRIGGGMPTVDACDAAPHFGVDHFTTTVNNNAIKKESIHNILLVEDLFLRDPFLSTAVLSSGSRGAVTAQNATRQLCAPQGRNTLVTAGWMSPFVPAAKVLTLYDHGAPAARPGAPFPPLHQRKGPLPLGLSLQCGLPDSEMFTHLLDTTLHRTVWSSVHAFDAANAFVHVLPKPADMLRPTTHFSLRIPKQKDWFVVLWGKRKQLTSATHRAIVAMVQRYVPVISTCIDGCSADLGTLNVIEMKGKGVFDALVGRAVAVLALSAPKAGTTGAEALACGTAVIASSRNMGPDFKDHPMVFTLPDKNPTVQHVEALLLEVLRAYGMPPTAGAEYFSDHRRAQNRSAPHVLGGIVSMFARRQAKLFANPKNVRLNDLPAHVGPQPPQHPMHHQEEDIRNLHEEGVPKHHSFVRTTVPLFTIPHRYTTSGHRHHIQALFGIDDRCRIVDWHAPALTAAGHGASEPPVEWEPPICRERPQ